MRSATAFASTTYTSAPASGPHSVPMPPTTPISAMSMDTASAIVDGGSTNSVYCAYSTPAAAAIAADHANAMSL